MLKQLLSGDILDISDMISQKAQEDAIKKERIRNLFGIDPNKTTSKRTDNPLNIEFYNLKNCVKSENTLVSIIIFENDTVHYINTNTTLKNIKEKIDNGLKVKAIIRFTKNGIEIIRDIIHPNNIENFKFSKLAKLIKEDINL